MGVEGRGGGVVAFGETARKKTGPKKKLNHSLITQEKFFS